MQYHRRALELFGVPDLPPDRARGLAVARLGEAAGVALPGAVAEWYGLPADSPPWRAFDRLDESILLCEGGDPARLWFGRPLRAGEAQGPHWALPPVCRDPRGWVPWPVLPLAGECCGGWWWGVALTGAADPPVAVTHDEGDTWDWGGPSFSAYVSGVLFDASFDDPRWCGREARLEGHRLEGADRHRLLDEFRAEPATRVPYPFAADLVERFSRDGQRLSVCHRQVPAGSRLRPDTEWRLWAAGEVEFRDLVGRLGRAVPALAGVMAAKGGPLSVSLIPASGEGRRGDGGEADVPF